MYEPLRVFLAAAGVAALIGAVIWIRFLYYFISGEGSGHIQSLILGATLFIVAVQLAALGVLGDVLASMRVLVQRVLERVRRVELQVGVEPSHYEPGAGSAEVARTTGAASGPATGKPDGAAESSREAIEA
jgi:hypothetical protein